MNLIPILKKTSIRAHMESELDVLGVPIKLVKYVAQKKNFKKKKTFTEAIQIAINHFLISRKFWG
jgi:hypothetical protein